MAQPFQDCARSVAVTPLLDVWPIDQPGLYRNQIARIGNVFFPARMLAPAKLCNDHVFDGSNPRGVVKQLYCHAARESLLIVLVVA